MCLIGADELDANHTVVKEDAGTKTAPGFKVKLEDKETVEGSEVKLEVQTEGYPAPEIKWYKNDKEIKANIEKYFITVRKVVFFFSRNVSLYTRVIQKDLSLSMKEAV